jgi:hypothetical protein
MGMGEVRYGGRGWRGGSQGNALIFFAFKKPKQLRKTRTTMMIIYYTQLLFQSVQRARF